MGQPEKTKQSGAVASSWRVVARCNGAMVIWDVEFSREGYKIKKVLGQKSILSNKEWTKKTESFQF